MKKLVGMLARALQQHKLEDKIKDIIASDFTLGGSDYYVKQGKLYTHIQQKLNAPALNNNLRLKIKLVLHRQGCKNGRITGGWHVFRGLKFKWVKRRQSK